MHSKTMKKSGNAKDAGNWLTCYLEMWYSRQRAFHNPWIDLKMARLVLVETMGLSKDDSTYLI